MQRNDKIVFFSFLSLNLFQWLSIVESTYGIPAFAKYLFSIFTLGVLIYYRCVQPVFFNRRLLFYTIILTFVLWSLYLLISSLLQFNDFFYIQRLFGQRYFYLPYLLPLIILFTKFDIHFFGSYFNFAYKFIFLAVILQIMVFAFGFARENWQEYTARIGIFDLGSGFLLLTAHYSNKKYASLTMIGFFLMNALLMMLYGRRGMLLNILIPLMFMIYIRLRSPIVKAQDRKVIYLYLFMFLIALALMFNHLSKSAYIFQRGFSQAAFQESRGRVFEDFFLDFASKKDWILGRGLDGTILRTVSEEGTENLIENGYLTIVLKCGLLYLIPMLLIFGKACYLGFFKSNNDLSKALSVIIFTQIIYMIGFGLPVYSTSYILIWISVSACFSPEIRQASNEDFYEILNRDSNIHLIPES